MNELSDHLFPIRHVTQQTGVLPVTLRAWERRYGLIKPTRTDKGHRLYSDDDIRTVRQIVALIDSGIPVGQVKAALARQHSEPSPAPTSSDWPMFRERLLKAVKVLDTGAAITAMRDAGGIYPLHLLAEEMLRPCMTAIAASENADRWASRHVLNHAISIYLEQRSRAVQSMPHGKTIVIASISTAAGSAGSEWAQRNIMAHIFEILARESGLDLRWVGLAPGLRALAELLSRSSAKGVVIWEDGEPLGDWQSQLYRFGLAINCPFAMAGDFSLRHQKQLQAQQISCLPGSLQDAITLIRSW